MHKYHLEFILNTQDISLEIIRNSLTEFGEGLDIYPLAQSGKNTGRDFKIHIFTEDPTIIFDTCGQFGRIKSIKVSEDL